MPKRGTFPFVNPSHDGRNSRHVDPGESGCARRRRPARSTSSSFWPAAGDRGRGPSLARKEDHEALIPVSCRSPFLAPPRSGPGCWGGGHPSGASHRAGAQSIGKAPDQRRWPGRAGDGPGAAGERDLGPRLLRPGRGGDRETLELDARDFEALKARAWVLLGQHRFAEARELAEVLNKRVPDDVMVYGLLTDANVELGDYDRPRRPASGCSTCGLGTCRR